jgi:F-type H+-transporting ATPase subunit delta
MDDIGTMSRPYAVAAFRQASEEGQVAQWADMLTTLGVVCDDPAMKGLIANPKLDRADVEKLILDVCGDSLSDTGKNFVRLLVENGRLGLAAEIERRFARERAATEGRREVTVISAYPLSDAEAKNLAEKVAGRLGAEVDLSVEIDKNLIGGVIIRAGDVVIDASLRGRLAQLSQVVQ